MFDRFNDAARHSIVLANKVAAFERSEDIRPEYLFCGLLLQRGSLAVAVLVSFGLDLEAAISRATSDMPATFAPSPGRRVFHKKTKEALERSVRAADERAHAHVGTEHLLLGVVAASSPRRLRKRLGVPLPDDGALSARIAELTSGETYPDDLMWASKPPT